MKDIVKSTKNKKERRVVSDVPSVEINRWIRFFSLHGRKTEFEISTHIPRQSLNNVLNSKKGLQRVVDKIREYYSEKTNSLNQSI